MDWTVVGVRCSMMILGDDSIYEHVNYVGCGPDGDEPLVPEDNDDCPIKLLLSEPLCEITEDMTYQEKLGALSGTIYDYDDVNDKRQEYLEYEYQRDCECWGAWDNPMQYDRYYDSDWPVGDGDPDRPDYSDALG